jgi:hypothetical protein
LPTQIRLGLSNQKHLPVWKIYDWTFALWDIGNLRRTQKLMKEVDLEKEGDLYWAKYNGFKLHLLRYHAVALVKERQLWEKYYAPIDLKGKTVLDVGSGCLETAAFYLGKGATKIVCVEKDPNAFALGKESQKNNPSMNVELLNEPFSLQQLQTPHDFLKMDIEGAENLLLSFTGNLGPCVIEAHKFGETDTRYSLPQKYSQLKQVFSEAKGTVPIALLQST